MPTPTKLPPELIRIIRDVLRQELPDFEFVTAELPRTQPAPPEAADRGRNPLLSPSPPLAQLQAHFKELGFGQPSLRLPEPREPKPDVDKVNDPDLIHCRIRSRDAVDHEAIELDVLISITARTVIGM